MAAEVAESGRDHPDEPFAVGAQGVQFYVGAQRGVAAADARGVEIDLHAAQPFDEPGKTFGSVVAGDVDGLGLDLAGGFGAEGFEGLLAASGGSDPPSCADAEPGDFESDARCGAHDDDTFHGGLIFRVSHTEYTKGMPEKQIFPEKRKNPGGFSLSYRFFPGFGFSPWSGVSNSVRCSAVSRAGAMRSR